MASTNHPLENNPNYTRLFRIRSTDSCDQYETCELYKHKRDGSYALFRFRAQTDGNFPLKILHKFTKLLTVEMHSPNSLPLHLYITTTYGDSQLTTQRYLATCGSLAHLLNVEKAIYDNLLN